GDSGLRALPLRGGDLVMATILQETPTHNGHIERYRGLQEGHLGWLEKHGAMLVKDIVFPVFGRRPYTNLAGICWEHKGGADPTIRGVGFMTWAVDASPRLSTAAIGENWPTVRMVEDGL